MASRSVIQRTRMHAHRRAASYCAVALLVLAFTLTGILAACGGSQPAATSSPTATPTAASIPTLTIMAMDFKFSIPATLQAGLVAATFTNDGKEPHELSFARINDGVSIDQFKAALLKFPPGSFSMIKWYGGIATIMPGVTAKATVKLDPGQYVAVCFVNSPPNSTPHFAEGMFQPFTVVQNTSQAQPAEPKADAEAIIKNFSFTIPTLKSGTILLKVTNNDTIAHEMNVLKLKDGKTLQDAKAYVHEQKGPPPLNRADAGAAPYTYAGGSQPLEPGMSDWVEMKLDPGNYAALCFVPELSGISHVDMGMIVEFTVA